ncbi:MAG TPA: hypothetical protein ENJ09_08200 [Planctomycetes bacterium]|nr:hypothetical protein [Planctomycetota bacterium]
MDTRKLFLFSGLVSLAALPSLASAQKTVTVGGEGAWACATSNSPATLSDGITEASADLTFDWDASTHTLWLTVENTSPVEIGVPNPLITSIYFNLPAGAVDDITLLSQSAPGSVHPCFSFDEDENLFDRSNPLKAGCMGAFGARLDIQGIRGAIANADADTLAGPPGSQVIGPATFEFHVDGEGVDTLTSSAFAGAFSMNPPGIYQVNTAIHFQAGGVACVSDFVGNTFECAPAGWMTGEPRIGHTVTFTMAAAPGCHGCLAYSTDPGPSQLGALVLPIGAPAHVLLPGIAPSSGTVSRSITIPQDPTLVGNTYYFAVATISGGGVLEFSEAFDITILP